MAELRYRRHVGEYAYGHTCPYCGNPKALQATMCWSCHVDRLRSKEFWASRSCPDCGAAKTPRAARCKPCADRGLLGNTHAVGRKDGGWSKPFRFDRHPPVSPREGTET